MSSANFVNGLLGNSINIHFNGENLSSVKSSTDIVKEWVLGPGLNIGKLELPSGEDVLVEEKMVQTHTFSLERLDRYQEA